MLRDQEQKIHHISDHYYRCGFRKKQFITGDTHHLATMYYNYIIIFF